MEIHPRFSRLTASTLFVSAVLLSSCNRGPQEKRIAFIPKGQAHVFWQSVHAGAIKAARENPGYTVIWNGPASETDYAGQIKIVDSALNQNVDAICLAPIDKKIFVTLVERAAAIGKPMIIFDSGVDTDTFTSQVATNNAEGGRMAARRLAEVLGKKGKVVEVAVQPGSASTMDREQGFESTLKDDSPEMKLVDKQFGMADFAKSLKVSENMLTAVPDLAGMFASNESSTVGAVRALQSKNRKDVKLVGFDSSPQLLDGLRSGEIDALIVQDPFEMGYRSMIAAITKLKGGNPDHIQNIQPTLVTRENMDSAEIQKKINPDLKTYLSAQNKPACAPDHYLSFTHEPVPEGSAYLIMESKGNPVTHTTLTRALAACAVLMAVLPASTFAQRGGGGSRGGGGGSRSSGSSMRSSGGGSFRSGGGGFSGGGRSYSSSGPSRSYSGSSNYRGSYAARPNTGRSYSYSAPRYYGGGSRYYGGGYYGGRGYYGTGFTLGFGFGYGYPAYSSYYAPAYVYDPYAYSYSYDPYYADPGYSSYGTYSTPPPPPPPNYSSQPQQNCSPGYYDQGGNWIPNQGCYQQPRQNYNQQQYQQQQYYPQQQPGQQQYNYPQPPNNR